MGIFNEHSSNQHPFARGVQGAPGVGFNLTSDGNYDMVGKKLTNVGNPTDDKDAVSKNYVDTHGGKTSSLTIDSNIDMKSQFSITKLKTPTDNDDAANKKYVDDSKVDGSVFLKLDGSRPMTGNLNMNNKRILNIQNPTGGNEPIPLAYSDIAYLKVDGSNSMTNNLNMNNKRIINLITTNDTDAATKKYVDDKSTNPQDLSPFFKKDGSTPMTGNLNLNGNKIFNLEDPASDNDAANKKYIGDHLHQTQVQPSHYKDEFAYLMSSPSQWTDEIDTRNSFYPRKIGDLLPSKGNFHDYNHKVLYMDIFKNFQGGYNFKMGLNFYRLTGGADYTLCLEILNTDYQLWHKTQISVDDNTSQGLQLGNVSVKKLQHRYNDSKNQTQYMYYHRVIINFKKLTTSNKFFLHILVNIPQDGSDLAIYPSQFSGVYLIAYGIMSKVSNIDPDKVYDYHTAFDIQKTQVKYNVDINANQKAIRNIKLERGSNNSAATVGMVKELIPFTTFTTNYIYRQYFEDFYDFTDATKYKRVTGSSAAVFTGVNPNLVFQSTKDLSFIYPEGLRNLNYAISLTKPQSLNFTICIVYKLWFNRNFTLQTQSASGGRLYLKFIKNINKFHLERGVKSSEITLPNSFNGKYVVIWLTGNGNTNIIKAAISNNSAKLTLNTGVNFGNNNFGFKTEDGIIKKFMYSPNFYDFDSDQYHRVMLQEKLNGSYIV